MKIIELKCKNCGSLLKIEEGIPKVTCEFCHTSFLIDDEAQHVKYDNMYENGYEFEKGRIKAQGEKEEIETSIESPKKFNEDFEEYSGTQLKNVVDDLLDSVVTNNKTNNRKIEVVYKRKRTAEPNRIIKLKHGLGDSFKKYEIILDYDDEGYVKTVTIEKIKRSLGSRIISFIITVIVIVIYLLAFCFIIKLFMPLIDISSIIPFNF